VTDAAEYCVLEIFCITTATLVKLANTDNAHILQRQSSRRQQQQFAESRRVSSSANFNVHPLCSIVYNWHMRVHLYDVKWYLTSICTL
jgi:hypothetical protein